MSKEHKVENFNDLCNLVNADNLEVLSEDVKVWLQSYYFAIAEFRKMHPKQTEGLTNTEIAKGSFTWVDDNENKIRGVVVETNGKSERVAFN